MGTARFLTGDYRTSSPGQMIADLVWEPFYQRRTNFKLVMVYCITYGLIGIPGPLYLHPSALSTRGHTLRYMIPYCRTNVHWNSFSPSAFRLWNLLPEIIVAAPTLDDFKMGLARHSISLLTCRCLSLTITLYIVHNSVTMLQRRPCTILEEEGLLLGSLGLDDFFFKLQTRKTIEL